VTDAPGARVPVRAPALVAAASDVHVPTYAPAGTVAPTVQDAVLTVVHKASEIAPASGTELPAARATEERNVVVTVLVLVMSTPPVVVVRADWNTASRGGETFSVTATVPAVTVPAFTTATPFHRA
jgi:hypothetical protein